MTPTSRTWADLAPWQRRMIVAVGVVTTLLQAWMVWDVWRRPAEQLRGSKRAWVAASFVRPVGQIAYLLWGRRDATLPADPFVEESAAITPDR